jgi:hypothetical protein
MSLTDQSDVPRKLEYARPKPPRARWRLWVIGPVAGTLAGVIDTLAALLWWVHFDQPDFYFRGWDGVEFTLQMNAFAGGVVGVVLAIALGLFEWLSRRRVSVGRQMAATVVLSTLVFLPIHYLEIRDHQLWSIPGAEFSVAGLCLVSAMMLSHKTSPPGS